MGSKNIPSKQSYKILELDEQIDFYNDTMKGQTIDEVNRFRDIILNSTTNDNFNVNPDVWFSTITKKINLLKKVEDKLSKDLIKHINILVEKEIKDPKIYITITSRGMQSIVIIKDNAGGIGEENLDLIFDPYYSTKDSSKGTGLGLYISKLIIEKNMGGELSVQNDNKGAVFKVIVLG